MSKRKRSRKTATLAKGSRQASVQMKAQASVQVAAPVVVQVTAQASVPEIVQASVQKSGPEIAREIAQRSPHDSSSTWSDLEEAFFAAAPPDDPVPALAPLQFDDLDAPASRPHPRLDRLRQALREAWRVFDEAVGQSSDGRTFWVVLATVMIVIGLSAAVFASRSGGHGTHRGEPPMAASPRLR
jgi:hypothetical protein